MSDEKDDQYTDWLTHEQLVEEMMQNPDFRTEHAFQDWYDKNLARLKKSGSIFALADLNQDRARIIWEAAIAWFKQNESLINPTGE